MPQVGMPKTGYAQGGEVAEKLGNYSFVEQKDLE